MKEMSFVGLQARSLMTALVWLGCTAVASGADTYDLSSQQLTIPTLTIGSATYSNVMVSPITLNDVLAYTVGGTPNGSEDSYDPGTAQLSIPAVKVGNATYTNLVVSIPSTVSVSIGSTSGADTWNPATNILSMPIAEYENPTMATRFVCTNTVMPAAIVSIASGMPKASLDVFNSANGQLAIPAVLDLGNNHVYTNVVITASKVLSYNSCGGNTGSLSGLAAAGAPVIGGTISVICAAGAAIAPTKTSSTGAWQVTLSGQTLPCAVEVSGGTISGTANSTPYDSIATAAGTVNITPLTDLLVDNLTGIATSGSWFSGLKTSRSSLSTITTTGVKNALSNLAQALPELPALGTTDPTTTVFTPTLGNVVNDMVSALNLAVNYNTAGVTYSTLRGNLASSPPVAPSAGFGAALTTASYTNPPSGNYSASGGVPCIYPGTTLVLNYPANLQFVTQNNSDGSVSVYVFYTMALVGRSTCDWQISGGNVNLYGNYITSTDLATYGAPPIFNPAIPTATALIPYQQTYQSVQGFYNLGAVVGLLINGPPPVATMSPGDVEGYEQSFETSFAGYPGSIQVYQCENSSGGPC
jgi:hypothetical protein